MVFYKSFSIVAFAWVLFLHQPTEVDSCTCVGDLSICDYFDAADIVLVGTPVSREDPSSSYYLGNSTVTISINIIYKGESDIGNEQEIQVTDSYYGTSCASNIYLGEESLIGISQDSEDGELQLGSSCSLAMGWPEDVSDEDVALLEAGCVEDPCDVSSYEDGLVVGCDDDPCGGGCLEFEECLQYERNEKWYCWESCDNDPCEEDEVCTTTARSWCRESGYEGCPEIRSCRQLTI